jgi:hypothetical protein
VTAAFPAVPSTTSAKSLPPVVRDVLRRVAAMVAREQDGFLVAGEPTAATVDGLADALYLHWYTTPQADARRELPCHRQPVVAALRAAHALAGLSADQWIVLAAHPNGELTAGAGERTRVLRPGEYVGQCRPGVPIAPGEPLRAVGRLDRVDPGRGFWWTFTEQAAEPPLGRIYLDVRPSMAARAVHEATSVMTALAVPYQLKCPVHLDEYRRVDAMVVYHPRASRTMIVDSLRQRWSTLGPLLDPAVPPFTREVAPGLSWADDDGLPDHSFGEYRCRALATALIAAPDWFSTPVRQRVLLLADGLRAAGIDAGRPWLAAR